MLDHNRVIRSRRVTLPDGVRPASIEMKGGIIAAVGAYESQHAEDFGNLVIMPGLVDTHVHINEPGRAEWEGFTTATRAAAAGGVTTLIDMPLNCIPAVTNVAALEIKIAAARGECRVDVGFWGGAIPGNCKEIRPLWDAGCFGFKCFLAPSGVDEFPHLTDPDLRPAMMEIAACGGILLAHAEDPAHLLAPSGDARRYSSYLASRPSRAEDSAIATLIRRSRETGCRAHIVHLSSSHSLSQLALARADGVGITVETCPHYLVFTAEEILDGATEFKCAPPIRERANREALWRGLRDGTIDFVVSDHSPSTPAMKRRETGDFLSAWGGIASLELGLPAVWTEARRRGFGVADVARWMSTGPAKMARLENRKGSIVVGRDADLVIWDPEASFTVEVSRLRQRHKVTPYAGRRLYGVILKTLLRGHEIDLDDAPSGRVMRRCDA